MSCSLGHIGRTNKCNGIFWLCAEESGKEKGEPQIPAQANDPKVSSHYAPAS